MDAICDSVVANVPLEYRAHILQQFATMTIEKNSEAAARYFAAAWREVPSHPRPWEAAANLLRSDPAMKHRSAWLTKFDQFILPALVDAIAGVDPLADLVRFDMDLLIDRTEKSSQHPARSVGTIFPGVVERAFGIEPKVILDWLEDEQRRIPAEASETESLRDRCIYEIGEFVSVYSNLAQPQYRDDLQRLCEVALSIEDRDLRLATLAALSAELPKLDCDVPMKVTTEGRRILDEDFRIVLDDLTEHELHCFRLLEANKQIACVERLFEELGGRDDNHFRFAAERMIKLIQAGRFPGERAFEMHQRLARMASERGQKRIQAEIAKLLVRTKPTWAVRTIWSLLPADRSNVQEPAGNIGFTPTPSDPIAAVDWLVMGLPSATRHREPHLRLVALLYHYLPQMPKGDRDPARRAIAQRLANLVAETTLSPSLKGSVPSIFVAKRDSIGSRVSNGAEEGNASSLSGQGKVA